MPLYASGGLVRPTAFGDPATIRASFDAISVPVGYQRCPSASSLASPSGQAGQALDVSCGVQALGTPPKRCRMWVLSRCGL